MRELNLATLDDVPVRDRLWGIVPAGARARRGCGLSLPWRHADGARPLRRVIDRAEALIPASRIVAVLSRGAHLDARGVPGIQQVVQPAYRGSGAEVFLPLSMIAHRAPSAIVVVLPAEGVGQDEPQFLAAVERAAESVATRPDLLVILGLAPPCLHRPGWVESDGYIPGLEGVGVRAVRRFLRQPSPAQVAALHAGGGLVTTGVVVAQAVTLLALGRRRLPDVLEALEPLEAAFGGPEEHLLREAIYEGMPYADLSHALFAADEPLGVLPIPRSRARVRPAASA